MPRSERRAQSISGPGALGPAEAPPSPDHRHTCCGCGRLEAGSPPTSSFQKWAGLRHVDISHVAFSCVHGPSPPGQTSLLNARLMGIWVCDGPNRVPSKSHVEVLVPSTSDGTVLGGWVFKEVIKAK